MYVRGEAMKNLGTFVVVTLVTIIFLINAYLIIFAPEKGHVTGRFITKNTPYLVIENDDKMGFVWVSWNVYFTANDGDIYDTECDCIVGQP